MSARSNGLAVIIVIGGIAFFSAWFGFGSEQELESDEPAGAVLAGQTGAGISHFTEKARLAGSEGNAGWNRRAVADFVFLPPQERVNPTGRGLSVWIDYYREIREAGTAPNEGIIWWTVDPEIVELFAESFPSHLTMNKAHLEELRAMEANGEMSDSGMEYLGEVLEFGKANVSSLQSELAWFRDQGLAGQQASELGKFLVSQMSVVSGNRPRWMVEGSAFAPFYLPLESHVLSETGVDFTQMDSSRQQYLREAYSQTLIDAAAVRAEMALIHMAAGDAAFNLGLPVPEVEQSLASEIAEIANVRAQAEALWDSLVADIREE